MPFKTFIAATGWTKLKKAAIKGNAFYRCFLPGIFIG